MLGKRLPRIFKTVIKKTGNKFDVKTEYDIHTNVAFFVDSGSLEARFVDEEKNIRKQFILNKDTIVFDAHYKINDSIYFFGNNTDALYERGFSLIALEDSTSFYCVSYGVDAVNKEEKINIMNVYRIKEEQSVFFPEDTYLHIVKSPIFVNGTHKKLKTWIHSSKDQEITVKPTESHRESLLFLMK